MRGPRSSLLGNRVPTTHTALVLVTEKQRCLKSLLGGGLTHPTSEDPAPPFCPFGKNSLLTNRLAFSRIYTVAIDFEILREVCGPIRGRVYGKRGSEL